VQYDPPDEPKVLIFNDSHNLVQFVSLYSYTHTHTHTHVITYYFTAFRNISTELVEQLVGKVEKEMLYFS
jgi:hypothetical protein